jgi:hypothetical protein
MATTFAEVQKTKNGWDKLDDSELVGMIERRYEVWLDQTKDLRRQWRLNTLFMRGIQWAVYDPSGRVIVPKPPPGKVRITKNLMKPWALDIEAKFDLLFPTFDVVPNSPNQEDKDAAIVGEDTGQHYWRLLKFRSRRRQTVRNCLNHGGCLAILDWDETVGPRFLRTGQIVDPTGEPFQEIETDGDVTLEIYSHFKWFCDEIPGELDSKSWLGTANWMTMDKIAATFAEGGDVEPEKFSKPLDDTLEALQQAQGPGQAMRQDYRVPGSTVFKWYMPPQDSVHDGLVVYTAGKKVLQRKPWPAAFAKLTGFPAVKYDWYLSPEQFRGQAPVEDQIPLQREINITSTQIIQNKNAMAVLKYLVPIGSGVDTINDIAGQLIRHTPNLPPSYLQPPTIPAYVFKHANDTIEALEDVQMLHRPSKGKVPPGVKSGVGINLLQEQDDRPLSIPEADIHEQDSLLFRKILQIVSVAVEEERFLQFVGRNKRVQVKAFKGSDLRNNTNIHLSVVEGATKSKAGIQQMLLEFIRVGAFRDPKTGAVDTPKVMEVMRHAIPGILYEEATDKHTILQRDENDILYQPEADVPMPQAWENHVLHLSELEDEMNSMQWKTKAAKDKRITERFIIHRTIHLQLFQGGSTGQLPPTATGGTEQAQPEPTGQVAGA